MKRKLLALVLVVSMIFCMFTGFTSTQKSDLPQTLQASGYNITVVEKNNRREASTVVEGVPIKCEHKLDTDEYLLYLEEEPIHLNVTTFDDHIEVSMADEVVSNLEDQVVGQYVLTFTLAVPAFISAAKVLLAVAAGYAATAVVYVSANAIGNVIGGIRYNTKTYQRYRAVDTSAAVAIRFGRMNRYNTYYVAYLSGSTVMVGREISRWEATMRLQQGYDVFATSEFAAIYVCLAATTNNNRGKPLTHHSFISGEGYYPHYHPLGRHWYKNYAFAPHCWYPY